MTDFKQRLFQERDELQSKLDKLTDFMHSDCYESLPDVQFGLLMVQHSQMTGYLDTLNRRIEILD